MYHDNKVYLKCVYIAMFACGRITECVCECFCWFSFLCHLYVVVWVCLSLCESFSVCSVYIM